MLNHKSQLIIHYIYASSIFLNLYYLRNMNIIICSKFLKVSVTCDLFFGLYFVLVCLVVVFCCLVLYLWFILFIYWLIHSWDQISHPLDFWINYVSASFGHYSSVGGALVAWLKNVPGLNPRLDTFLPNTVKLHQIIYVWNYEFFKSHLLLKRNAELWQPINHSL